MGGAEFELYVSNGGGDAFFDTDPDKMITVGDLNFYLLASGTTNDATGVARFKNQILTRSFALLFMFVETKAPDGYITPGAPNNRTFFYFHEKDSEMIGLLELLSDAIKDDAVEAMDPLSGNRIFIPNDPKSIGGTGPPETPKDPETPEPSDPPYVPGGTDPDVPPNPPTPGNTLIPDGDGWIELDEDNVPLGRWDWDDDEDMWIFDDDVPLAGLPKTGDSGVPVYMLLLMGASLSGLGVALSLGRKKREKHE